MEVLCESFDRTDTQDRAVHDPGRPIRRLSATSAINPPKEHSNTTMQDPRLDLERLPSEQLFGVARNTAAVHRLLAIQILVERASPFAGREEIAAEARQFVFNNPIILKKVDPAAAAFAASLPGVVDCIADGNTKHIELARVVGEHHAINSENHLLHTGKVATLETVVN